MAAEALVLRLASTIPAALGAWAAAAALLGLLRVRDGAVRSLVWTWAALAATAPLLGLPAPGLLDVEVVVPTDWPGFRGGALAVATLVVWAGVAAVLVARRHLRDRRLAGCLDAIADDDAPADLRDAVARTSRWLAAAPPRIAAADTDGTAFVAGFRAPVLFVPLALWRRLDARGRRALLLHELAHVRRRDPLRLRVLASLVDLLWPALPVRWIAARLRDAWEAQADEEAVHGGATRSALARSLVEASTEAAPAGVPAFGGEAASTLRRLTDLRRSPRAAVLALQTALVVFFLPWLPVEHGANVSCRMEHAADRGHRGVVSIGAGFGSNAWAELVALASPSEGRGRP